MTSIKTKCNSKDILDRAKLVLKIEFEEIQAVSDKLDDGFVGAIELILSSNGRVIVTGMGKSGHIGKKYQLHWPQQGHHRRFCTLRKPIMVT